MEKRTWTVTLADGTALEGLGLNGNNFISTRKLTDADFAGKLEHVTITDGETTTELTNVELVQCMQYGTKYWLVLREMTAEELEKRNLLQQLADANNAVAELSELVAGMMA